jgi:hypothetical protein
VAQSVDIEQLDADGFFPKDERDIADAFDPDEVEGKDALGITLTRRHMVDTSEYDIRPVSVGTEIKMLFAREVTNLRRDITALASRFGLSVFLGILIGVIFLNVGETDTAVPSVSLPICSWLLSL